MHSLAKWGTLRTAVVVLTAITALYYALVAFGNLTDWHTNFDFVDHVFEMDDTFQDKDVMWRKITNNGLATVAYWGVIIWEILIATVLITALVYWLRGRDRVGRRLSTLGWIMVFVLFAGGFLTIGGEWFQMWQNKTYNGTEPAFRNFVIAALGVVMANLLGDRHAAPEADGKVDLGLPA